MRIQRIFSTSFNQSDLSMLRSFYEQEPEAASSMGPSDVVVFVSRMGSQILFVHGFRSKTRWESVVLSTRFRLTHGRWNPSMITEFAKEAKIKLENAKALTEFFHSLAGTVK